MAHVFISYVHEDDEKVKRLVGDLESRGIEVWLDRNNITPGTFWKQAIREAIMKGDFFIFCFSQAYYKRKRTFANEELTFAIDELRLRPTNQAWFIPILLDKCDVPNIDIGAGKTLQDIQYQPFYDNWEEGIKKLLYTILPESREWQKDWANPRFRKEFFYLPNEPLLGFVKIQAGNFFMGSHDEGVLFPLWHRNLFGDLITLPTYYIARYPITVQQFEVFLGDADDLIIDTTKLGEIEDHPVVNISWYNALIYCSWLDLNLRKRKNIPLILRDLLTDNQNFHVTLPSEAEWEKAARGTFGIKYPWGDKFDPLNTNTKESNIGKTTAVGHFPRGASPYGIMDMCGNVWEWTRSLDGFDYPYSNNQNEREDLGARENIGRIIRGGAFNLTSTTAQCISRSACLPETIKNNLGFRVVISPLSHHSDSP